MKRFISSFLIFSTLSLCLNPGFSCFAASKGRIWVKTSSNLPIDRSRHNSPLSAKEEAALRQAILELAKDKKFTDQIMKNYKKAHEDSLAVKLLKLPFKIVYKIICKLFDYTIGYWVGEKLCKAVEGFIVSYVVPAVGACYLYKKSTWFKKHIDSLASYLTQYDFSKGQKQISNEEKNND